MTRGEMASYAVKEWQDSDIFRNGMCTFGIPNRDLPWSVSGMKDT